MTLTHFIIMCWVFIGLLTLFIGSLCDLITGSYFNLLSFSILGPFALVVVLTHQLHLWFPKGALFTDRFWRYSICAVLLALLLSSCGPKREHSVVYIKYSAQFKQVNDTIAVDIYDNIYEYTNSPDYGEYYVLRDQ